MEAKFIKSSTSTTDAPAPQYPEYLFVWRSNVGKSSLINTICSREIAKVSKTPGKTVNINHFLIDNTWFLVDLPGYGYAKQGKKQIIQWEKSFWKYLYWRDTIEYVCVLIDSSISPQKVDIEFMEALVDHQVPFVIIFTKSDKDKQRQIEKNIQDFKKEMLKTRSVFPPNFITSSSTKKWIDELLDFFEQDMKN